LKKGNVTEASALTDHLYEQDLEEGIKKAAEAQKFIEKKEQAKRIKITKKRQKLVWG